jgi:hypothetical protein
MEDIFSIFPKTNRAQVDFCLLHTEKEVSAVCSQNPDGAQADILLLHLQKEGQFRRIF